MTCDYRKPQFKSLLSGDISNFYTTNNYGLSSPIDQARGYIYRRMFPAGFLDSLSSIQGFRRNESAAFAIKGRKVRHMYIDGTPFNELDQNLIDNLKSTLRDIERSYTSVDNTIRGFGTNSGMSGLIARRHSLMQAKLRVEQQIFSATLRAKDNVRSNTFNMVIKTDNNGMIPENPLNCYTDTQYHISLTMISEADALFYQKSGFVDSTYKFDLENMKAGFRHSNEITFASTGETFGVKESTGGLGEATYDTLFNNGTHHKKTNLYNIMSTTLINSVEPTGVNPLLSAMIGMKMKVVEPAGFQLHEDIIDTAKRLNYKYFNAGRLLYRVDIYFSGYTEEGDWVEQINISTNKNAVTNVSYMMNITSMSAEITSSGTVYDIDLAPSGHLAYRPEDFILDATAINSGKTFGDFLQNLSTSMKKAKSDRTQGMISREYEFILPSVLKDSPFDVGRFMEEQKLVYDAADPSHTITSGKNVDLLSVIRGALANTFVAQKSFNGDSSNAAFTTPRILFTVRFNTIYGYGDARINDYNGLVHQYFIEPYLSFRQGAVSPETITEYMAGGNQITRLKKMLEMGMVRRVYNYINTEENTDVMSFNINLSTFYYRALNNTYLNQGTRGANNSAPANDVKKKVAASGDRYNVEFYNANPSFRNISTTMAGLFGTLRPHNNGGYTAFEKMGGGFGDTPANRYYGDTATSDVTRRNDYETNMIDYLTTDLMQLDGFSVRGDPSWLASPYGSYEDATSQIISDVARVGSVSTSDGTQNPITSIGSVIYIRMYQPQQDDYLNKHRRNGSSSPSVMGGFYQITQVVSSFNAGIFQQSLSGNKLVHLNYIEELFERGNG